MSDFVSLRTLNLFVYVFLGFGKRVFLMLVVKLKKINYFSIKNKYNEIWKKKGFMLYVA